MKKNKSSNNWSRYLKLSAAALSLSLASLAASAGIIGVGFETIGSATWGASCGVSCTDLSLAGTASVSGLDKYFGTSGTPDFTFSALLNVTSGWAGSWAVGQAPTGGWRLQDGSGDSLYGWVNGWLSGTPADLAGVGLFDYGVTGGTGLFDKTSGSGGSLAGFYSNGSFGNAGALLVDTSSVPTATVPEPPALGLFALGLAAIGWSLRRRRFTLVPSLISGA